MHPGQGSYIVYILASRSGVLYIGVTNDMERRMSEHKAGFRSGFASRYNVRRLVYFEGTTNITSAIQREKQLKGWVRKKKIALIESVNPGWKDLSESWHAD